MLQVAISRYRGEETLEALDKQYWIPEAWTMRKLEKRIRYGMQCVSLAYHILTSHVHTLTHTHTHLHTRKKDLRLESEQPLYLTIDNKTVVEDSLTLKEVYNTNRHKEDKHLHVAYSSKDIADPDIS